MFLQEESKSYTLAFLQLQLCTPSQLWNLHSLLCSKTSHECFCCKYMHTRITAFQEPMICNNSHFLIINYFSNIVKNCWSLVKGLSHKPSSAWIPVSFDSFTVAAHPGHCSKGHKVDEPAGSNSIAFCSLGHSWSIKHSWSLGHTKLNPKLSIFSN